jgi:signal transduction histidine kinase
MHPEDLERAGHIVEEAIASKTGYEVESRLLHKDGHYVPIVTKGIVLRNDRGHAVRAIGTNTDLTEQKKLEQERILSEQRRQQVQKAESLKRMAGSVAHNFNNMLGVVIGNLELVMDDLPQDEVISTNISEAFQAANRAADLTRLMLTYLGHPDIKHERMDLSNTCDDHIRTLRKELNESIVLNIVFQRPGPVISGNAIQIRQILKNLVTNASESLDPGGGTIRLSIKTVLSSDIPQKRFPVDFHPQETSYACLEVRDTGCGIPDKNIEYLFDPFYTTKFTGRGLGLPVVLGLVQEHDGVVTVESTPSKGSIFRLFFPLQGEIS